MKKMTDINNGFGNLMLVKTTDIKLSEEFANRVKLLMQESIPTPQEVHFWRFYENPSAKEGKDWMFNFCVRGEGVTLEIRVANNLVRKKCNKTIASTAAKATRQLISRMVKHRAERLATLAFQASEAVDRLKTSIKELEDLQNCN